MAFDVTSDQELIRKTVREFVDQVVTPKVAEKIDRDRVFPRDIVAKAAELGLLGLLVPAEKGGAGTDTVSFALAIEEVARRSGTLAGILVGANVNGTWPLAEFGGEAAMHELPKLVSGERVAAWALSEPGAGSDMAAVETRAQKSGEPRSETKSSEHYVLDGVKSFVMGAPHADVLLVFARLEGADGLTCLLVQAKSPGVSVAPAERMMTLRGAELAQVFFKGVKVPHSALVGAEGDGLKIAAAAGELSRIGVAAMATGLMVGSLDESREFSGERKQFRAAIKTFQGIQWKIADMDVNVRASRLLTLYAAARRDRGEEFGADAAAAKLFAGEAAKAVTQQALRIHGGAGFMRELPLERMNRDARSTSIYGGTSEVQRAFLAAKLLDL
ncbi:MAG: acyl-CoA dehydrogenase family protein [Thermoplasmatota archaeon]